MLEDMKNRAYLILALREGQDFSYEDVDEAKNRALKAKDNGKDVDYRYIKEYYGSYSNIDTPTLEIWNMHTYVGQGVSKDKIRQLTTEDGREDALSVFMEIYDRYRGDLQFDILDEFIEFAKEREKHSEVEKKSTKVSMKEAVTAAIKSGVSKEDVERADSVEGKQHTNDKKEIEGESIDGE